MVASFIRSNQTIEYYRNLLAASRQHLHNLSPQDMALTLGWAIRLLKYYDAVPETERQHLDIVEASPSQPASRPLSTPQLTPAQPSPSQPQPAAPSPSAPRPRRPCHPRIFLNQERSSPAPCWRLAKMPSWCG